MFDRKKTDDNFWGGLFIFMSTSLSRPEALELRII